MFCIRSRSKPCIVLKQVQPEYSIRRPLQLETHWILSICLHPKSSKPQAWLAKHRLSPALMPHPFPPRITLLTHCVVGLLDRIFRINILYFSVAEWNSSSPSRTNITRICLLSLSLLLRKHIVSHGKKPGSSALELRPEVLAVLVVSVDLLAAVYYPYRRTHFPSSSRRVPDCPRGCHLWLKTMNTIIVAKTRSLIRGEEQMVD